MKIGSIENKLAVSPTAGERKAAPVNTGASSSAEPSAKVDLSTAALQGADAHAPVFDAEKVQRISAAIRDGKFEIDAEVIADKLISNAQELLSPRGNAD